MYAVLTVCKKYNKILPHCLIVKKYLSLLVTRKYVLSIVKVAKKGWRHDSSGKIAKSLNL